MKNIIVLSRLDFKNILGTITEQQFASTAFISIHDPFGANSELILDDHTNVLNLHFDDAEYGDLDDLKVVLFDDARAEMVADFVKRNSDKKNFVIHCTMGISRSGAVGDALSTYFGVPYEMFKRNNPKVIPNSLVRSLLNKHFKGQ